MKAVDLFSDLKINRWWFHKLSKKIKIQITEIKLLSATPRIGSDILSFLVTDRLNLLSSTLWT